VSILIKTASRSHAKPATDSHGKTATMLSLLILEMLTSHAGETDRLREKRRVGVMAKKASTGKEVLPD
jgi:hypothetical protein